MNVDGPVKMVTPVVMRMLLCTDYHWMQDSTMVNLVYRFPFAQIQTSLRERSHPLHPQHPTLVVHPHRATTSRSTEQRSQRSITQKLHTTVTCSLHGLDWAQVCGTGMLTSMATTSRMKILQIYSLMTQTPTMIAVVS